jgi:5-methyltetrahydrofolate--homocysteine methyltransferase
METILKSATKQVSIAPEKPVVLIGERINPTGKKKLAEALREGNLDYIISEAKSQMDAGADVLDVNVGTPGVDEMALAPKVVRAVMESVPAPICVDSADPKVLRAALEEHRKLAPQGKALINSVSGEESRLINILPLAAEFKTAVIGLLMDETGIPKTTEARLNIAKKIVERAVQHGIPPEDILIDCLVMTVGADSNAGKLTLDTIVLIRRELGLNITIGASNVSHGLPEREVINPIFLAMAIQNGVNCPIVDVAKVRPSILAADLLLGRDGYASRYIKDYKRRAKAAEQAQPR